MSEKSEKKDCERKETLTKSLTSNISPDIVKKRGRPKGAKNKPRSLVVGPVIQDLDKPRRGRPKGAKNKPKEDNVVFIAAEPVKRRGRPKGAKNKAKPIKVEHPADAAPRRRGRPKGAKNKNKLSAPTPQIVAQEPKKRGRKPKEKPEESTPTQEKKEHPIFSLLEWIEKNMHPMQVQYYRSRASRNETTLQQAIAADILGFFNIKETEELKHIKKNNFIANISNELHY